MFNIFTKVSLISERVLIVMAAWNWSHLINHKRTDSHWRNSRQYDGVSGNQVHGQGTNHRLGGRAANLVCAPQRRGHKYASYTYESITNTHQLDNESEVMWPTMRTSHAARHVCQARLPGQCRRRRGLKDLRFVISIGRPRVKRRRLRGPELSSSDSVTDAFSGGVFSFHCFSFHLIPCPCGSFVVGSRRVVDRRRVAAVTSG